MRTFGRVSVAAWLAALATAGCVSQNERVMLGRDIELQAFAPETESPDNGDGASIENLERANWGEQRFIVPVDGTGHRPTYATVVAFTDATARQRAEFPTPVSALSLDDDESRPRAFGQRAGEVAIAPPAAFVDALLMLPRLFLEPQTLVKYSPAGAYARSAGTWPARHPTAESDKHEDASPAPESTDGGDR